VDHLVTNLYSSIACMTRNIADTAADLTCLPALIEAQQLWHIATTQQAKPDILPQVTIFVS